HDLDLEAALFPDLAADGRGGVLPRLDASAGQAPARGRPEDVLKEEHLAVVNDHRRDARFAPPGDTTADHRAHERDALHEGGGQALQHVATRRARTASAPSVRGPESGPRTPDQRFTAQPSWRPAR